MCQRSHIIPDFMYQDFFDEKHRIHLIQSDVGTVRQRGYRQTGEHDKDILCHSCDNESLGRLDRYASLILYDGRPKILENRALPTGMTFTYCADIDYTQFKLFLLSVLWRASVSHKPLFKEVSLGPHEECIRQRLVSGDPGEQLDYPCLIMTYHIKELPADIVAQPSLSRVDGGHVYKFVMGGLIYLFFVSKRRIIPSEIRDFVINPKGEMKIIHSPPRLARKALGSMIGIRLD